MKTASYNRHNRGAKLGGHAKGCKTNYTPHPSLHPAPPPTHLGKQRGMGLRPTLRALPHSVGGSHSTKLLGGGEYLKIPSAPRSCPATKHLTGGPDHPIPPVKQIKIGSLGVLRELPYRSSGGVLTEQMRGYKSRSMRLWVIIGQSILSSTNTARYQCEITQYNTIRVPVIDKQTVARVAR